jgi:DNA-binding CsgD family transcriptional regulator
VLQHRGASALVGRQEEVSHLLRLLEMARQREPQFVIVEGDPGIGKTRLCRELAGQAAAAESAVVAWTRTIGGDAAPAMWPWAEALRALAAAATDDEIRADLGRGAAVVAHVIPEFGELFEDLAEPPSLGATAARFRLFDALRNFLSRRAGRAPLLVVIDDLQDADLASLLFLEFLATQLRDAAVMFVGTCREGEVAEGSPLAETLASLQRSGASWLRLRGLPAPAIRLHLQALTGEAPGADLLAAVMERTEGNPFFVNELVHLLLQRNPGPISAAQLRASSVPQQIRAVAEQRLRSLPPRARAVLEVAAVQGREFDLGILERCLGAAPGPASVLEALRDAEEARLVGTVPGRPGTYAFAHALLHESLYGRVDSGRRAELHARVGRALARNPAGPARAPHVQVASHLVAAALAGLVENAEEAVDHCVAAADDATAQVAFEAATEISGRAIEVALRADWDEARQAPLFLALGEAQNRAGQVDLAKTSFLCAARIAGRLGDAEQMARAALGYRIGILNGFEFTPPEAPLIDLLEATLEALPPGDSVLRARVLSRLAMELYFSPQEERRRRLSDEAVAIMRRLDDPGALAETLIARHVAQWTPEGAEERLRSMTEVIRIAVKSGDRELELQGHYWGAIDALELGDVARLDASTAAVERLAGEVRHPTYSWWAVMRKPMRAMLDGSFGAAEQLAADALTVGLPIKQENAIQAYGAQLLLLRWEQGRLDELRAVIAENSRRFPGSPVWRCALAFTEAGLGNLDAAAVLLRELLASGGADLPPDFLWLVSVAQLAEVACRCEDAVAAGVVEGLLEPFAGRWVTVGPAVACFGPVSRLLAMLAITRRDWDRALSRGADALRESEDFASRPWFARAQVVLARLHQARGLPGDRERALELAEVVEGTAGALEMTALEGEARALRERLHGPAPIILLGSSGKRRADTEQLTRREREVHQLAREGMTAREIGERLFVSQRTVETHLANIYAKLGVRSRVELLSQELKTQPAS